MSHAPEQRVAVLKIINMYSAEFAPDNLTAMRYLDTALALEQQIKLHSITSSLLLTRGIKGEIAGYEDSVVRPDYLGALANAERAIKIGAAPEMLSYSSICRALYAFARSGKDEIGTKLLISRIERLGLDPSTVLK